MAVPGAVTGSLPDFLGPGLELLSIGLNPSIPSVQAGFYFANPRNRFWRALNAARLVPEHIEPGPGAEKLLFDRYRIGFTDVVKRPTPGLSALRAPDFRRGAPVLRDKLLRYRPLIAWFHGKEAYRRYLRYTGGDAGGVDWGEQALCIGAARVFVTPNPSPANAAYSLEDLAARYAALKTCRDTALAERFAD